jgi:hypothetical protein
MNTGNATTVASVPVPQVRLDIGRCFADAADVYRRNFWPLVGAAILFDLLSLFTLFVLAGPLCGGWCILTLNALSRPDRKVEFGLLFAGTHQFATLLVLFVVTTLAQLTGLMLLVLPGLLLMTFWLFPFHLAVDRNLGVADALTTSARIVRRRGLGPNFMLAALVMLLNVVPVLVPYAGWLLGCFLSPLGWLLVSAAYIQEVRNNSDELADLLPQGFPVQGPENAAPVVPDATENGTFTVLP